MEYGDLYEVLRGEKNSESLQLLDVAFISEFADYLKELRNQSSGSGDLFGDSNLSNKQVENSIAIFRNLILRRKKKLLNLVFVAAETEIVKKDYENMLDFEKKVFDKLVEAFEKGDKELAEILNGKNGVSEISKRIIFEEDVEEFADMNGNVVGPFSKGDLADLDSKVCEILVSGGKADFVD